MSRPVIKSHPKEKWLFSRTASIVQSYVVVNLKGLGQGSGLGKVTLSYLRPSVYLSPLIVVFVLRVNKMQLYCVRFSNREERYGATDGGVAAANTDGSECIG